MSNKLDARRERKNLIEFVDKTSIRKISMLNESNRLQRLQIESRVLIQARMNGVNVPKVLDYYRNSNNQEVLVMERIFGRPISLVAPEEKKEAMLKIGPQMMQLAGIIPNFGWIDPISFVGNSKSWRIFILSYVKNYGARILKSKIIFQKDLDVVNRFIENLDIEPSESFLLNRDFRLSHFLRDDVGKIWILDWENAILGDPLYDLAIFAARYGEGALWQNLKTGYGLNILPSKYCLYKTVALIGIIDYCQKNKIDYLGRLKKLMKTIDILKNS
ncbi:MAG: aminoglycoside phosphotransferase family protein [Bacteroidales bacterium]|nr:aminoglycoside phosphotransferase family protein [Bacteroidales bacterium]